MSCVQLDEDSFSECCRRLLTKSDQLRDGWSWETVQGSQEGYLRKTVLCSIVTGAKTTLEIHPEFEQSPEAAPDAEDGDDEGAAVTLCSEAEGDGHLCVQFEFHVVFSSSYRTPVLYFRATSLEGKSLSLEEVWSVIRPKLRVSSQDALLHTVTQQEHPLLGQVFFMLHPCKTEDFMRPVLLMAQQENREMNYVLTWLSAVAPLVGLEIPLDYSLDRSLESKPD